MAAPTEDDHQRGPLVLAYARTELTVEELWTRCFALGGDVGLIELEAYLEGVHALPANQRDIVAVAVNERLDELVGARVPYSRTVSEAKPHHGPLAALVELLEREAASGHPPPETSAASPRQCWTIRTESSKTTPPFFWPVGG